MISALPPLTLARMHSKPRVIGRRVFLAHLCLAAVAVTGHAAPAPAVHVGVAKIDITPELPIRLSGYGNRAVEATRGETKLFARALAIGSDAQQPVVLITVELIGIGEPTTEAVAAALREKHGLPRERLAISATHTHTGPALADVIPFMFSKELPSEEQGRIDRYTAGLRGKLIAVASAALADRKPARIAWGQGSAGFAAQRRKIVDGKVTFGVEPAGPHDHALPVMKITDERGTVRAVFANYACHCTTLAGGDNFVHSEWAGDAALRLEAAHAGAVVLFGIGCGADSNPNPRGVPSVPVHGATVANEIQRVLAGAMRPLGAVTNASFRRITLDLDHAVTREDLQKRLEGNPRVTVSYPATKWLEQLDAGKPLPTTVPYPVQAWSFGSELTMVFLGGEVVSEYSLRLRRELDPARVWVNAYSNHVPCYIPSKRMFPEGGYEVDGAMDYYGWPTRLAIGTEDRIIKTVHELVPAAFKQKTQQ
ncbi:MAG TPA: neutral/alkaline non-lysosomal ceramidase N-terminal domain-containing protein [Opitutaceae bacterium]|nr:neutral/alkaline non-lysosomal ceramidase N-terminal domain-containing protein [Opitutaceae bacterium]